MKPTKLKLLHPESADVQEKRQALESIDALRKRVEDGETVRFGLVDCRSNGDYTTEFTSCTHRREDAAMLIELALRMLGFVSKNKNDEIV